MKIALLSDIHGNVWALEPVLNAIQKENVDKIINLGDSVYGPLKPHETAQILINENIETICGNQDEILFTPPYPDNPTFNYVQNDLSNQDIKWLEACPHSLVFDEFCAIHGTIDNNMEYFVEDISNVYPKIKNDILLQKQCKNNKIILCGHSHTSHFVKTINDNYIINPGSVGLQAYDDDLPNYHIIENGTPHARFAIITINNNINIDLKTVVYDWQTASEYAKKNNRFDWCTWLSTGRVENRGS